MNVTAGSSYARSALVGAVIGTLVGFTLASGVWLLSVTTYPYGRTVGGATLILAVVGAFVGVIVESER